ncbi:hypothetical protein [Bacillus phage Anath]|uniref:Uncharacterized protein n=1 Tax=Bacillus phage Anath TaxID=2108114 RepID=A0A2P1JUP4_9CAUD|nr:hypothetical protein [Bacillus phage Anath]
MTYFLINAIVIGLIGATAFATWKLLLKFGFRCQRDKKFADKMRLVLIFVLLACVVRSLM